MIEALLMTLQQLLTFEHMLYLIAGVFLGISIGILPGLGGIVGFSIMLPFLYGMDATSALALLIGLVAVIPTSDTFTSVLMGIPGSSSSQATILDGYPLAKKGEAARALSAAFSSSLIGGLIGALILMLTIVFARPLILSFTSAELFSLAVLGLSMVGVLSGKNINKGFIACGLGLLMGAIGGAPATGEWRLTFGSYYLFDGLKLVIVSLGIFAIPEIVDLLVKNKKIASEGGGTSLGKGWFKGLKDTWIHKWVIARCAPLGALIGAIPGLGGSVVDWIAYGHVVQTTKDKSNFGKGEIRGVIAPESANNAKEGGGLIPTLLFGIPGSGSMAVFLGGLTILGIEPGPGLVQKDLHISYTIIWSLALANVIGTGTCILLSNKVSKVTQIQYGYLGPFMIMVICFAAIQATRSLEDLLLLLGIGVVGILFKYFNWSRPALLIGFVLSDTIETYLYQALQFYSWSFLTRPGVIVILVLTVVSIVLGNVLFKKKIRKKDGGGEGDGGDGGDGSVTDGQMIDEDEVFTPSRFKKELFFIVGIVLFALYALYDSRQHEFLGLLFPISVSIVILICIVALLYLLLLPYKRGKGFEKARVKEEEIESDKSYWVSTWRNFLWFCFMALGSWLLGFVVAIGIIFISIIKIYTNASWLKTLVITGIAIGFLLFIQNIMTLHLPMGLIYDTFFY